MGDPGFNLSLRQFASIMSANYHTMRRAIDRGIFTEKEDYTIEKSGKNVRFWFHPEKAAATWRKYTKVRKPGPEQPVEKIKEKMDSLDSDEETPEEALNKYRQDEQKIELADDPEQYEFLAKKYKAKKAMLEYKQLTEELVKAADVRYHARSCGRATRDAFMTLPAKLSSTLSTMEDAFQIERFLLEEFSTVLNGISAKDIYGNEADS